MELTDVLAEVFEVPAGILAEDVSSASLGAWTSLRHVALVATLEEVYGLSLSGADIRSITSVGKVRATLRRLGADV